MRNASYVEHHDTQDSIPIGVRSRLPETIDRRPSVRKRCTNPRNLDESIQSLQLRLEPSAGFSGPKEMSGVWQLS